MPYVAVATNLETGEEVVIDHGPITEAVRASISLPGTLAPHRLGGRVLVDGGAGAQAWEPRLPPRRRLELKERVRQLLAETWMRGAPDMRRGWRRRRRRWAHPRRRPTCGARAWC